MLFDFDVKRSLNAGMVPHEYEAMCKEVSKEVLIGNFGNSQQYYSANYDSRNVTLFKIGQNSNEDSIIDPIDIIPNLEGAEEKPDVKININLESFHLAKSSYEEDLTATMRITLGSDKPKGQSPYYWALAAGLDLMSKDNETPPSGFGSKLMESVGNKLIEIPNGSLIISFALVKHKEPEWWRNVFGLANRNSDLLTSILGFPSITKNAVKVVDEFFNKLSDTKHELLIKSRPLKFALTQTCKDLYTFKSSTIKYAGLNSGFYVLTSLKNYGVLKETRINYNSNLGLLVSDNDQIDLSELTYAVLRLELKETNLED